MNHMINNDGQRVGLALDAVRRMHADVSRLLVDTDGTIGKGKESVFRKIVTRDLTYNVRAAFWMAWFAYRYYATAEGSDPNLVEAVTVWFFDKYAPVRINEPHLLLGQLWYDLATGQEAKDVCKEFDLVDAYAWWSTPAPNTVLFGISPQQRPSVRWFKVIGVPLYTIRSKDQVVALMNRVRNTKVGGAQTGVQP
jgi:hypothetical protein